MANLTSDDKPGGLKQQREEFLAARWLGLMFPLQEEWVQSLVGEQDPISHGVWPKYIYF